MSSSDETTTHERLTETRSWSEYDEDGNVTADHTTVRAICGTCYREQIDRHGHLEYVSADWPCDGAENARLRERVAALEGALYKTHRTSGAVVCRGCGWPQGGWPDPEPSKTEHAPRCWAGAALAQADDGGRA